MNSSEILRQWYKYARENQIRNPKNPNYRPAEDTDVHKFLVSIGISSVNAISAIRSAMSNEDLADEPEVKTLNREESSALVRARNIVDKMNRRQKQQLLRDLKNA